MTRIIKVLVCAATALVAKGSPSAFRGPRELNVPGQHGGYKYDHVTGRNRNLGSVAGTDDWADCTAYEPATGGCAPSATRCWQRSLSSAQRICTAHEECTGITRDNCGYEPRRGALKYHVAAHESWIKQREYATIRKDGRPLNYDGVKGTASWNDCTQYSPAEGNCAPTTDRCWQKDLASAQRICNAHKECTGITRDNCGFEPRTGGRTDHVAAHEAWEKLSGVGVHPLTGEEVHCPSKTTFSEQGFCYDSYGQSCKLWGEEAHMEGWASCDNCSTDTRGPMRCTRTIQ